MSIPGKMEWVRDWNLSESTYRRVRAILERSTYWQYQQMKPLQAILSRGNLLVNAIMALADIFPLSVLLPIAPNHSLFFISPNRRALHQITQEDAYTHTLGFTIERRQTNPPRHSQC